MNKIEVKENNIISNFPISIKDNTINLSNIDLAIIYEDCNNSFKFKIDNNVKLFEYYKNSKVNNSYDVSTNSKFILNRFSNDCSLESTINLNRNSSVDYKYSCINLNSNTYIINVNHNDINTSSKLINNGLNLSDSKLEFIINSTILKQSINSTTNQENSIILLGDNNSCIKPNLIIDNNEIDANHSAYLGSFKEESLFYLQSRGISLNAAKKLLAKAHIMGIMDIDFSCKNLIFNDFNSNWRC